MSRFTVRVELFGKADEDDYEKLRKKMQAKKYFRVIKGKSGNWYHLPSSTYHPHRSSISVGCGGRSMGNYQRNMERSWSLSN
jgi:hypothetical protein